MKSIKKTFFTKSNMNATHFTVENVTNRKIKFFEHTWLLGCKHTRIKYGRRMFVYMDKYDIIKI